MKNFFQKHRIIKNSVFILLALVVLSGGTYGAYYVGAQFSDWANIGSNITAGTLDLTTNGSNDAQIISISNMKPGETRDFTWTLRNAGSVDGILDNGTFSISQTGGAAANGPELAVDSDNSGDLSSVLLVQVYVDGAPAFAAERPISGLTGTGLPFSGMDKSLNAYTSATMLVRVHWPLGSENADNACQGDTLNATASLKLIQKTA